MSCSYVAATTARSAVASGATARIAAAPGSEGVEAAGSADACEDDEDEPEQAASTPPAPATASCRRNRRRLRPRVDVLECSVMTIDRAAAGATLHLPPRLSCDIGQPLAEHLRDTAGAHGHPVQHVGDLHRALLMGDHDQLAGRAELRNDIEHALRVDVVERGFDLVEHIERRRACCK